jgi:hypothetical protein
MQARVKTSQSRLLDQGKRRQRISRYRAAAGQRGRAQPSVPVRLPLLRWQQSVASGFRPSYKLSHILRSRVLIAHLGRSPSPPALIVRVLQPLINGRLIGLRNLGRSQFERQLVNLPREAERQLVAVVNAGAGVCAEVKGTRVGLVQPPFTLTAAARCAFMVSVIFSPHCGSSFEA